MKAMYDSNTEFTRSIQKDPMKLLSEAVMEARHTIWILLFTVRLAIEPNGGGK